MELSLKKERMIEYLEGVKAPGETFRCMLWGVVYADTSRFQNQSLTSKVVADSDVPGVAGSSGSGFCYIGVTDQSLYVIALDSYNTSIITGTFAIPFASITGLTIRKALLGGSRTIEITCDEWISLTVKSTSIGTNIKDQKERMGEFLAIMESLKSRIQ